MELLGRDITGLAPHARVALGLVRTFQINQLFNSLTPLQSLAVAVSSRRDAARRWWQPLGSDAAVAEECESLLAQFRLSEHADRPTQELPYGKRRLLEIALAIPGTSPTNFPRTDLVTTFLTGIPGVNKPAGNGTPSEMLRLNTDIAPVPFAEQNRLGIVGAILAGQPDGAGFPNGRRPKDDVVDIALVAVMGGLCMANGNGNALGLGSACNPAAVPLGATAFNLHDAVDQAVVQLLAGFPYLSTPLPGAGAAAP